MTAMTTAQHMLRIHVPEHNVLFGAAKLELETRVGGVHELDCNQCLPHTKHQHRPAHNACTQGLGTFPSEEVLCRTLLTTTKCLSVLCYFSHKWC